MKYLEITAFGATADGSVCTASIQRTIDLCPQGGTVVIPAGTFVSGALFLKSNMTLRLEKGARLLGSGNPADYPLMTYGFEGVDQLCYASLLNTDSAPHENIRIEGTGMIDANGAALFALEMKEAKGKRGRIACIRNTDGLSIEDVSFRQSPSWGLHLLYCSHVLLRHIEVHTKYDETGARYAGIYNGDGIDLDSCQEVCVEDCLIASQDDSIAVKSGRDVIGRRVGIPSKRIRIERCRFHSGFGVAIGSEMAGGVEDVIVRDCTFTDTFSIASIKAPRGRGAYIRDIHYERCHLINRDATIPASKWFRGAIYIDGFYGQEEPDMETPAPVDEGTPVIENLYFTDIEAETVAGYGLYVCGLPESPVRNIVLTRVHVKGEQERFVKHADIME